LSGFIKRGEIRQLSSLVHLFIRQLLCFYLWATSQLCVTHVLFPRPVLTVFKWWKCPGSQKNCWKRSALQQNIDGQTRWTRKKNRIKRMKT